jgi:capsular exopolysaccharide synthesis family protein
MLGIGAAFLRQGLDRRIREAADVPADMGGPVLGYVRGEALGRGPVALTGRKAPKALDDDDLEPLRILRTNLGFLDPDGPLRTILVTSPLPEEGKSTVATSLAWLEAVGGRRTLLVDCDLRRPSVAQRFGVSPTPGLSDYLAGRASPAEILQTVAAPVGASPNGSEAPAEPQLVCIAAGTPAPNPAELLGSVRFRTFLAQVAEVYDRVVLDSPPLLPVGDTLELLPQVDGVLLCLRFGQTTRDQALAGRTALSHFPAKPTGIVLTGVRPGAESGDFGYYAYTHRYPATSAG